MAVEIKVPEVGESITEGILVEWLVEDGAFVEMDQPLFELETDKITMTVNAEAAGKVSIGVAVETKVEIGQVVGKIDPDAVGEAVESNKSESVEETKEKPTSKAEVVDKQEEPTTKPVVDVEDSVLENLMPAVRRLVIEKGINPAELKGSGPGGRILKEDVLSYVASGGKPAGKKEAAPKPAKASTEPAKPASPKPARESGERQTRKPMSSIRKRIAERLLEAKHSTAMLTTFNEVDMTNLLAMRARYKDLFEKKYGIKLGIMSFFIKAAVDALQTVPEVNRIIDGEDLVENHYYDIGVAVSTERGLMVPVIRDVDTKSFAEVELELADLAMRAREGKIGLDELKGGVFTITNGGVFGSMLSTPILNPPQAAILGMHATKKRPVVIEGDGEVRIEIRPMMYLAMSYDHRVIDGRESVTFLKRVVEVIENPERMMFEV